MAPQFIKNTGNEFSGYKYFNKGFVSCPVIVVVKLIHGMCIYACSVVFLFKNQIVFI